MVQRTVVIFSFVGIAVPATAAETRVADPLFAAVLSFDTGSGPYSVAIKDLNGDVKPDLVVANRNSSTVSVLLGLGDGTFGTKTDFATGGYPHSVAIGDLNGREA